VVVAQAPSDCVFNIAPFNGAAIAEIVMYKGKAPCVYDDSEAGPRLTPDGRCCGPPAGVRLTGDVFLLLQRLLEKSAKLSDPWAGR